MAYLDGLYLGDSLHEATIRSLLVQALDFSTTDSPSNH
jgi:hypothetical protein